ncbi:oligopeptide ABC transporter [Cutibacterium acnes JCM 18918]|nr:oligopeptide ABC transporter [Cutibacterium acnes JCM 18918]
MQHLIDQEGISKIIWNRTASPTCGPVPQQPGTAGSSKGCAYDYNPAKAEKLLKDHGWNVTKDGITTCQQAGEGEGQCGKGIKQGAKLSFTVISQSGFTSTTHMFAELKSSFFPTSVSTWRFERFLTRWLSPKPVSPTTRTASGTCHSLVRSHRGTTRSTRPVSGSSKAVAR